MNRSNRIFAALLLALFAGAVAVSFSHDGHDRACAETCHICSFSRMAQSVDLTVSADIVFIETVDPLFTSEKATPQTSGRSLPSARAPPAA